jgi:16S rRNA (guanine966-N2)-methyltransferase
MTRIVSGRAGGRQLQVPAGGTRPTSDRVREALFSSLDALVDLSEARVLDLYAGTGALGLEAASRGAGHVTLVESARAALTALRANAALIAAAGGDSAGIDSARIDVRAQPVESFLAGPVPGGSGFDVVFADPPYDLPEPALASVLEFLGTPLSWLARGAIVVVERAVRSSPPGWPLFIQPIKHKRYGDTVLWYGRHEQEGITPI